jgi:hypothetical protein
MEAFVGSPLGELFTSRWLVGVERICLQSVLHEVVDVIEEARHIRYGSGDLQAHRDVADVAAEVCEPSGVLAVALYRLVRPDEILGAGSLPIGPDLGQWARSVFRKDDAIELAGLGPIDEK